MNRVDPEALAVKEKYKHYLAGISGVTGVDVNGSVIIYVERLTPQLLKHLPKQLDGVPVRIVKSGKLQPLNMLHIPPAHAIYAQRTARFRPALGGVSIGHPLVTAGTLGCRAFDVNTGEILGLSNNHVIALRWGETQVGEKGDSILQPGPADDGLDPDDKIGELTRWEPVKVEPYPNLIDAAVFSSNLLADNVLELGKPNTIVSPSPGMNIVKSGRTSGVTFSKILGVNASVKVEGAGNCLFEDQITCTPSLLSPGDSGSWVGEVDTLRTVGLGFAGSPEMSVINKGVNVERILSIEIEPPVSYFKTLTALGLWGTVGFVAAGMITPAILPLKLMS